MYQYNLIQYCNTLPFLFLFFQELLPLWNLSRTSKFLGNFSSYSIFDRWRKKKKNRKKTPPHNQGWPCIDHLDLAVTAVEAQLTRVQSKVSRVAIGLIFRSPSNVQYLSKLPNCHFPFANLDFGPCMLEITKKISLND